MKRYLIKCLPFVKRIETKWKRGKKKRKKSRKRGKTRCSDGGWNTIARFVKNSCATFVVLAWNESPRNYNPWLVMAHDRNRDRKYFFFPLYIYIFLFSFPFHLIYLVFECRDVTRNGRWNSLSLWSSARTTVIDVKRACGSREDRQLRQVFDYYSFFCTILFQNCIGKLKV